MAVLVQHLGNISPFIVRIAPALLRIPGPYVIQGIPSMDPYAMYLINSLCMDPYVMYLDPYVMYLIYY